MAEKIEVPKAKKCDYCDDFAVLKAKREGIYTYLCEYCHKNLDKVRSQL